MAEVQRASTSSAEWWLEDAAPKVRDDYDESKGLLALEYLAESLGTVKDAVEVQDYVLSDATRFLTDRLDVQALVDTVAMIQDLKRALGVAEAFISREVGYITQAEAQQEASGHTSDGRPYEVKRGSNRKTWEHDAWKADVRTAVLRTRGLPPELADPVTGDLVNLYEILNDVQQVHGSTAPKVTALKRLGLDVGDYCETSAGPFSVSIQQTTTNPTTTGA
jgi:hypothetical protein